MSTLFHFFNNSKYLGMSFYFEKNSEEYFEILATFIK